MSLILLTGRAEAPSDLMFVGSSVIIDDEKQGGVLTGFPVET